MIRPIFLSLNAPTCPVVLERLLAEAQTKAFHLGFLLRTLCFPSPSLDLKVPGPLSPFLVSCPSQGSSQSSEGGRMRRRSWKKAADSLCFIYHSALPCLSLAQVLFALATHIGAETATSPGPGVSPKC